MRAAIAATLIAFIAAPASAQDIINAAPADFAWERTPEGVAFAPLRGDRFAEAYMAMVELPAGLVSPAHVKSAAMFGVVTQGAFVHTAVGNENSPRTPLEVGAFYEIPAGVPHVSECVSTVPCVTFLYQDGAFDFTPVTATGLSE